MKRFKRGFSLAEVLLAIGIISVIATIGFKMTQKGIDRAYDAYVFNGLNTLNTAVAESIAHNHDPSDISNNSNFYKFIAENLLNTTYDNSTINANNGITYSFTRGTYKERYNSEEKDLIMITMSVPTKKTRTGTTQDYTFLYLPNTQYPLLPYNRTDQSMSTLGERIDLLTYTVDNGLTGRRVGNNYQPAEHYNFRDAFCRVHGDSLQFFEISFPVGAAIYLAEEYPGDKQYCATWRMQNPNGCTDLGPYDATCCTEQMTNGPGEFGNNNNNNNNETNDNTEEEQEPEEPEEPTCAEREAEEPNLCLNNPNDACCVSKQCDQLYEIDGIDSFCDANSNHSCCVSRPFINCNGTPRQTGSMLLVNPRKIF